MLTASYSVPSTSFQHIPASLAQVAGLVEDLILNARVWEMLPSHTAIPSTHGVGNFLSPNSSAFGFFFELCLMSRSAHSYKPFKAGKKHLLSAHPLENQTQNKHLQCAWMLWNVREGLPSPEAAPPNPDGVSGLDRALSRYGLQEPHVAECIMATLPLPHLATWHLA